MSVSGFVESPGMISRLSESKERQALILASTHSDSVAFFAAGLPISLFDSGNEDGLSPFGVVFWAV